MASSCRTERNHRARVWQRGPPGPRNRRRVQDVMIGVSHLLALPCAGRPPSSCLITRFSQSCKIVVGASGTRKLQAGGLGNPRDGLGADWDKWSFTSAKDGGDRPSRLL